MTVTTAIWILGLLAAALTPSAKAETSACLTVKNDLDRLACYDKETGRTPVVESVPSVGAWAVEREKSAITDDPNVTLFVESEEGVTCGLWNDGDKALLIVRCQENTTSLIVSTGCHMTSSRYSDYGDVDLRTDDDSARTVAMTESTDNRSLGLWSGREAIPIIRSLLGKKRLLVRARPYGENAILLAFPIAGLDKAAKPMAEACGWSLR